MKRIILIIFTLLLWSSFLAEIAEAAPANKPAYTTILDDATALSNSGGVEPWCREKILSAQGTTSSGSGSATVSVKASQDGTVYHDLSELALTLETTLGAGSHDYYVDEDPWKYVLVSVTAISGTGASVDVQLGCQWGSD